MKFCFCLLKALLELQFFFIYLHFSVFSFLKKKLKNWQWWLMFDLPYGTHGFILQQFDYIDYIIVSFYKRNSTTDSLSLYCILKNAGKKFCICVTRQNNAFWSIFGKNYKDIFIFEKDVTRGVPGRVPARTNGTFQPFCLCARTSRKTPIWLGQMGKKKKICGL